MVLLRIGTLANGDYGWSTDSENFSLSRVKSSRKEIPADDIEGNGEKTSEHIHGKQIPAPRFHAMCLQIFISLRANSVLLRPLMKEFVCS